MAELTEGQGDRSITFNFPDTWATVKYDAVGGYYKNKVEPCQGMKAVDFLVLTTNKQLWFEVKNFRGSEEENRIRLDSNDDSVLGLSDARNFVTENGWNETISIKRKKLHLADEVTQKVRDTCSALLGVINSDSNEILHYAESICAKKPIHIVLFLQQDENVELEFRRLALRLAHKIQSQILFLNATVEVVNRLTISQNAEWNIQG